MDSGVFQKHCLPNVSNLAPHRSDSFIVQIAFNCFNQATEALIAKFSVVSTVVVEAPIFQTRGDEDLPNRSQCHPRSSFFWEAMLQ